MPEIPMSGVRSQLLPWHGELSTRSLEPAASTAGWLASMAKAGSLELLGRYGDDGLPTDTFVSAVKAPADVGGNRSATTEAIGISNPMRRVIVDSFLRR